MSTLKLTAEEKKLILKLRANKKSKKVPNKKTTKIKTIKLYTIVVQKWLESEAGWGIRSDGLSIHLTEDDKKIYIDDYWKKEKEYNPSGVTPECYSRPDGNSSLHIVSEKVYKKLLQNKRKNFFGIRLWINDISKIEENLFKT